MIRYLLNYDGRILRLRIRLAHWKLARVDKKTNDQYNKLREQTQAVLKQREINGLPMPKVDNRYARTPSASGSRYAR